MGFSDVQDLSPEFEVCGRPKLLACHGQEAGSQDGEVARLLQMEFCSPARDVPHSPPVAD